jgi:hypothetical protein
MPRSKRVELRCRCNCAGAAAAARCSTPLPLTHCSCARAGTRQLPSRWQGNSGVNVGVDGWSLPACVDRYGRPRRHDAALGWPPGSLLAAQTVALSGCHRHPGDPVHPSNSVLLSATHLPFCSVSRCLSGVPKVETRGAPLPLTAAAASLLPASRRFPDPWPVFITRPRCSCRPQPVVYPHPSRPLLPPR